MRKAWILPKLDTIARAKAKKVFIFVDKKMKLNKTVKIQKTAILRKNSNSLNCGAGSVSRLKS
jgi:hypothetical protein